MIDLSPALLAPLTTATSDQIQATLDTVKARYCDNRLPYHNLGHVLHTLKWVDALKEPSHQHELVKCALLFHDVIYDPKSKSNEAESAAYAAEALGMLEVEAHTIDAVAKLIMATQHHRPETANEALIIDADLAILGEARGRYTTYALGIRGEYGWVAVPDYVAGRTAVLTRFLEADTIYHTLKGTALLETQARINLDWELTHFLPNL